MNALHATVLATQCKRYAEVIDAFKEEVVNDMKMTDQERQYITLVLESVCSNLKKLSDEIHNDH